MRVKDLRTADMFELIPQPASQNAGSLACRVEIANSMSTALKGLDRYDVAAKMSRLLGRDISKFMLDAYTAESREEHIPPFDTAIAFDIATGTQTLLSLSATKQGARVLVGKEVINAEIGKLQQLRDDAAEQIKELKKVLGRDI